MAIECNGHGAGRTAAARPFHEAALHNRIHHLR
jgi:hypothetical protein